MCGILCMLCTRMCAILCVFVCTTMCTIEHTHVLASSTSQHTNQNLQPCCISQLSTMFAHHILEQSARTIAQQHCKHSASKPVTAQTHTQGVQICGVLTIDMIHCGLPHLCMCLYKVCHTCSPPTHGGGGGTALPATVWSAELSAYGHVHARAE